MPGERTPMAKRKAQEAKKPRKATTKNNRLSDTAPETIEVKPHKRQAPRKKLKNGLDEIEKAKSPKKRCARPDATECEKSADLSAEAPEPLDPNDETDAEIIRISDELVASETRRLRQARKLTHTNVRAALRETAGILVQAAELLGCSRASLYKFIKSCGLEEELEAIRDDILDQAEATIKLAIMGGNLQTAMWYLTKMGAKRGYVTSHQVQQLDKNGQPTDPRETILAYRPVLSPDSPPPVNPVL